MFRALGRTSVLRFIFLLILATSSASRAGLYFQEGEEVYLRGVKPEQTIGGAALRSLRFRPWVGMALTIIGKAPVGSVYFARLDEGEAQREVVLKLWNLSRPEQALLAENEISILVESGSTYLLPGHYGFHEGHAFAVFERKPGQSLHRMSEMPQVRNPNWILSLAQALLRELTTYHSKGVVHCDLAGRQIIVDGDEEVVRAAGLVDFETAHRVTAEMDWLGPTILRKRKVDRDQLPPELRPFLSRVSDSYWLDRLGHIPRDYWALGVLLSRLVFPRSVLGGAVAWQAIRGELEGGHSILLSLLEALLSEDPGERFRATQAWMQEHLGEGLETEAGRPVLPPVTAVEAPQSHRLVSVLESVIIFEGEHSVGLDFSRVQYLDQESQKGPFLVPSERDEEGFYYVVEFHPYGDGVSEGDLENAFLDAITTNLFVQTGDIPFVEQDREQFVGIRPWTQVGGRFGLAIVTKHRGALGILLPLAGMQGDRAEVFLREHTDRSIQIGTSLLGGVEPRDFYNARVEELERISDCAATLSGEDLTLE